MRDPNLARTIIFIARHSVEDGAFGFVLNRPLQGAVSGEQYFPAGEEWKFDPDMRLFWGGPVETNKLAVVEFELRPATGGFRIAREVEGESGAGSTGTPASIQIGFIGYAGWGEGQLEGEIAENAWLPHPPVAELLSSPNDEDAWVRAVSALSPQLALEARAPENPGLN